MVKFTKHIYKIFNSIFIFMIYLLLGIAIKYDFTIIVATCESRGACTATSVYGNWRNGWRRRGKRFWCSFESGVDFTFRGDALRKILGLSSRYDNENFLSSIAMFRWRSHLEWTSISWQIFPILFPQNIIYTGDCENVPWKRVFRFIPWHSVHNGTGWY